MGTEYYAVNIQNKTFYDLGKGGWYGLTDTEAFQDEEYLCNEILVECYFLDDYSWRTAEEIKWITNHVKTRVAPDLFAMMTNTPPNKIKIVNDCVDDMVICKSKGYKCIGTRYYEPNSSEYQEAIARNNKHLDSNPLNKVWYNPDNYKDLPRYNEY